MKKILCVMLSCLLVISGASGAWAVVYGQAGWENEGYSEESAWEIPSAAVLAKVRDDVNDNKVNFEAYYKLTKDIDLTGEEYRDWVGIGTDAHRFKGHFNGNGHTIKVNISWTESKHTYIFRYVGLFGRAQGASIKNLSVSGYVGAYFTESAPIILAGGIVGEIWDGTINNCSFEGTVAASSIKSSGYTHVGGIVGQTRYKTSITNCKVGLYSPVTIIARSYEASCTYAGGIVGTTKDSDSNNVITDNYSRVKIKSAGNTGGIYGYWDGRGTVRDNVIADPDEPAPEPEGLEMTAKFSTSGKVKKAYTGTAEITGGTEPYTWEFEGNLPPGLKLRISGTKARITGKPTQAGSYTFKITASDSNGDTSEETVTLKITSPAISGTLSDGVIKKSYSATLKASGGTTPYTWTKASGTLPTGLTLNKTTGKLSGTPTEAGTFTFKVKVTDKNKATATKSYTITITKPSISGSVKNGTVGKSYSVTFKASEGTAPYTWTKANGTLPAGLKLGKTTGKLSGTPTKAGKFTFKIQATDANGATATKSCTVTIKAASSASVKVYTGEYEKLSETENEEANIITEEKEKERVILHGQNENLNLNSSPETHSYSTTELQVLSDDVLSHGTGRDEDLVSVRANEPVRFIIGGIVNHESEFKVYINDEHEESIIVSDEGMFTLPAEFVHDDFRIQVKAGEFESQELYISSEE